MFKILVKDLMLFASDRKGLLMTFLLPILLSTIFVVAYGGLESGNSVAKPTELLWIDHDSSALSEQVRASLAEQPMVLLEPAALDSARWKIRQGQRVAALWLGQGFADSVAAGQAPRVAFLFDGAREVEAKLLLQPISEVMFAKVGRHSIAGELALSVDRDMAEADEEFRSFLKEGIRQFFDQDEATLSATSGFRLEQSQMLGRHRSPLLIQAVAGVAVMLLLFSVSSFGGGLLEERENGTLKRLLYSHIRPGEVLWAKWMASVLVSMAQLVVVFGFAALAFGLELGSNPLATLLMMLGTAVACASIAMLLAALVSTRQQLQGLSTIVILLISAIGGSMIPLFMLPAWVKSLAVVSVNYWTLEGFYDIFWRELPGLPVWNEFGVLLAIGAACMLAAMFFYRRNLRQVIG